MCHDRVGDVVILKKKTYKEIGHVLEVVVLIALLILMAGYVDPRFGF